MDFDLEMLGEVVTEAKEHLATAEADLLAFEQTPEPQRTETINRIFRAFHSIKGCSSFVQLDVVGRLAHELESLLLMVREGRFILSSQTIPAVLQILDKLAALVDDAIHSNNADISRELARLEQLRAATPARHEPSPHHEKPVTLVDSDGRDLDFQVDPRLRLGIPTTHTFLYLLNYDLHEPGSEAHTSPVELVTKLQKTGFIVDSRLHHEPINLRIGLPSGPFILELVYSTVLNPDLMRRATGLPAHRVRTIRWSDTQQPTSTPPTPTTHHAPDDHLALFQSSPDMLDRFANEATEMLDSFEKTLLDCEKEPATAPARIEEALRIIHNFKGNCGFMGFADSEALAHAMENLLTSVKQTRTPPAPRQTSALLEAVDTLRGTLKPADTTSPAAPPDLGAVRAKLTTLAAQSATTGQPATPPQHPTSTAPAAHDPPTHPKNDSQHDIRVDIRKLDTLINRVGELVIAEAMVVNNPLVRQIEDETLERAIHQLRRISADLQDIAMSVRMVPLAATFSKMNRVTHDVAHKSGKLVHLQLAGEETEVDKSVIELIGDPLVHLVRNAVDHGLETPAQRRAAGKPETGRVLIQARHEGGEVWISITDDGRGIQKDRIIQRAIERGLLAPGSQLTDSEAFELIFEPGFSTAEHVTDISGRGVGMDIVRKNLDKLNGRVRVTSRPGLGTTITLRVPLTLAIIDGMLVRIGNARYTVPLLAIRECVRPEQHPTTFLPEGQPVIRIRDDMIPVLPSRTLFNLPATPPGSANDGVLLIVEADGRLAALHVDEILGQNETVIKGLSPFMGHQPGLSGCTILSDGDVSLILDVSGLIHKADSLRATLIATSPSTHTEEP